LGDPAGRAVAWQLTNASKTGWDRAVVREREKIENGVRPDLFYTRELSSTPFPFSWKDLSSVRTKEKWSFHYFRT
jgi:hypothetical protein